MVVPRGYSFLMIFLLFSTITWGQTSNKYSSEYADYYRAEELFGKEQYSAAREVFSEFINGFHQKQDPLYVKARYYLGMAALELYNNDAIKLLTEFNQDYPENIYKNDIYFKIGEHFYQRKKYKDAKEWMDKTNPAKIDTALISAYHFKLGYSNFQLEEYTAARNEFHEIKDGKSNYSPPAMYYYSYIAYKNKTYQEALRGFLTLKENPVFEKEAPYYITQIYYLLGDYENVIKFTNNQSDSTGEIAEQPAEMNLIIGDSYYQLKDYHNAIPYLEDYSKRKTATRDESYTLAFSYFKDSQYDKAIPLFDRIARTEDKLAQVSFYHIAQSYIQKEELNYARSAFKSASNLNYDLALQEDALYNYAVLSYKLDYNPYNEAIKAFEHFLKEFPNSEKEEDVYSYLVNVYMTTKNYAEAIKSLERIPNLNVKLKTAYQVVAYNMGIEKYERGDYTGSIKALKNVSKYDISPAITGKAKFWEADAHFMLKQWSAAIKGYRDFLFIPGINDLELKEAAYYNIAYAYFEQKDWIQAIQAFRTFTQLSNIQDKSKLSDAYARIGDCYYTKDNPDFEKAALNYESSLNYGDTKKDRTLYSLASVYKRIPGKRELQIETLQKILKDYPKSSYVLPAIFDIAIGYKNSGAYDQALKNFNVIVNNYPNNIIVKDALIEIADVKFKQLNYQEAESYFKRVLNEYSLDDETCKRVSNGIVDIYRAMRRQDEIVALGKQYPCAGISEDDEEIFFYETASELFVNEKYDEAIPEINKYLNRFPDGRYSVQLLNYLASIYYQREENEKALEYYEKIIERPNSIYTEEALLRSSKLLYNNKKYSSALPYYKKLETLASKPEIIFNTRIGLMRTNYLLMNYKDAVTAAIKVLKDELLSDESVRIEANYIAGMSDFKLEEYEKAIEYLRWTADNTGKERGTEALFTLAECYFHLEDYQKAEKLHNELLKRKPAYDYWIAKSLILQTKVFIVTNNLFQAEQTIDLVISNYPNHEDGILEDANQVKSEILQLKEPAPNTEDTNSRTIDLNNENNE